SASGGYAEYVCAKEEQFARSPSGLALGAAAAIPHGGYTALQALRDVAKVREGQRVLVLGASGAVGSMAVQIAKVLGAEVTGVCSAPHVDSVRLLGADRVIDYTREHFADDSALRDATQGGSTRDDSTRYDAIIDTVARDPLHAYRRVLAPRGCVAMVAAGAGRWTGGMGRVLRAVVSSMFRRKKFRSFLALPSRDDLETLNGWIEAGDLTPQLGRTFPLSETAEAFRLLERKTVWGRIVVSPSPTNEEPSTEEQPTP
ncbi:MAG: NAD(P)-dependent alcohol dehydrogenase, partial [Planctomycetota bacterium]